jgi:hypothetical protein
MATLEQLVREGTLKRYHVDLEPDEQPARYLYATPEFESWFANVLSGVPRDRGRDLTPAEQVDQCFYEFIVGEPMAYGLDCRKLDPLMDHVWELKTIDVRIFGWFPKKATFLMASGELKLRLRSFKAYAPYVKQVVSIRNAMPLDPPKALEGGFQNVI